jgi:site-specific recombinase XerD
LFVQKTFIECAEALLAESHVRARLGEASKFLPENYKQRLEKCRPQFKVMPVRKVDRKMLKGVIRGLAESGLKPSSINPVMSFISMVLKWAEEEGYIVTVPAVPRAKHVDTPRAAFTRADYISMLEGIRQIEKGRPAVTVRGHAVDWELRAMLTFLVNAFIRPGDLFVLKHRHIEVCKNDDGKEYLRLDFPSSKGHAAPVITMPNAAGIYRRLLQRRGTVAPNDYLFMPARKNRRTAQELVRRQFNAVLVELGLKLNGKGEPRSMYSLRHSAITFRLLNSENLDLLTLARNCRTSVEMIDRFYARSLTAEMNRDLLHSFRRPPRSGVAT